MMISRSSRATPLLLGGLFIALAAPAFAQGTAEQREACTEDAIRLCPDAIPDVDRTTACMKRHEAQLSRRCHRVFSAELNQESPSPRARRGERDLDGPRGGYAPRAGERAERDDVAPRRAERRPIGPDDAYDGPRRAERYPAGPDGEGYDGPRRAERYPTGPDGDDYDAPRRADRGPYGPDGDDGYGPRRAERLPPGGPYGEDGYGPRRYLYLAPQGRQVETPDDAY